MASSLLSWSSLGFALSILCCTIAFSVLYLVSRWFVYSIFFTSPLRGIPGPSPESWTKGNLGQLFNRKGLPFHQEIADNFGGLVKVYGFFGDEQLYVSDPRALQSILVRDQDAFEETSVFIETNRIIFGEGLVATTGDHHKRQRKIVNPVFSVAQLRQLIPVFYEIAEKLTRILENETERRRERDVTLQPLDMSEWMSRVALETVGQTVLGYSFDPLDSPYNNPYTSAVKDLIPALFSLSLLRQFAPFLTRLGPPWVRRKIVEFTPVPVIQKVKNMSDVMYNTARLILREKTESLTNEKSRPNDQAPRAPDIKGRDIISVLLRANNCELDGEKLTESELIGQMTVLIFGAQDTTSSALSRILYMLSIHPEVQEKVRQEIRTALQHKREDGNSHLSYDDIISLPWLDSVIKETMRLYPPVTFVRRTAVKERTIPLSEPISSADNALTLLTSVTIPAGTTLFVGIAAANRLESVWGPDAKQWKPERWLKQEREKSNSARSSTIRLPGVYEGMLTFLGGQRACIGYKFAQVEMKIILITLLSRLSFSPTQDEIVWNLSQIISPSVRVPGSSGNEAVEKQGLPLYVQCLGNGNMQK